MEDTGRMKRERSHAGKRVNRGRVAAVGLEITSGRRFAQGLGAGGSAL